MLLENLQAELAEVILNNQAQFHGVYPEDNIYIYHNNIISNLIKVLKKTYQIIHILVGEDYFNNLAKKYIHAYPSRNSDLQQYGEYFSNFLSQLLLKKDLSYLKEIAAFEWICHIVLLAADVSSFKKEALTKFSFKHYEELNFTLHPACRVKAFCCPILSIIDLCLHPNQTKEIVLNEQQVNLLIMRKNGQIVIHELKLSEFNFLLSLQQNNSLQAALNAANSYDPHFILEQQLTFWIQKNIIVDVGLHEA